MTPERELRELIAKWRKLGTDESIAEHFGRASAYEDCADELEKLLAAAPAPTPAPAVCTCTVEEGAMFCRIHGPTVESGHLGHYRLVENCRLCREATAPAEPVVPERGFYRRALRNPDDNAKEI
jgi:hypothetical protein